MITHHQQHLKKKAKFFKLNVEIQILQKEINANFVMNKKWQIIIEILKIVFNAEMITQFKRIFKSKELFQYNEKSIREHIDYIWKCIAAFWLIFENFQMKNFKIIFIIQILINELKNFWYCFEKNHFGHQYIFKNFWNFFFKFCWKFNELSVLFCSVFQRCEAI